MHLNQIITNPILSKQLVELGFPIDTIFTWIKTGDMYEAFNLYEENIKLHTGSYNLDDRIPAYTASELVHIVHGYAVVSWDPNVIAENIIKKISQMPEEERQQYMQYLAEFNNEI